MIFNNIDFSNFVKIEQIRRPFLPPVITQSLEIPNFNGAKFLSNRFDAKTIEVDIRIIEDSGKDVIKKVRELAQMLYTAEPKKLELDDSGIYDLAILDGATDFEKLLYTGSATLSFLCLDPISYKKGPVIKFKGILEHKVEGTYKTLPRFDFKFTSEVEEVRIGHLDKGESIAIKHSFKPGDKLEVDFSRKWKTKKNDENIDYSIQIESDFFYLDPGVNNLGVYPEMEVKMTYEERWL